MQGTIDWSDPATAANKKKIKKYAFDRLQDRWKQHKSTLKKLYWVPNQGTPERFKCSDNSVDKDQWIRFVEHLDDSDTQVIENKCELNLPQYIYGSFIYEQLSLLTDKSGHKC